MMRARRPEIVRARVTRDEGRELRRRARMAGMTVSDYIRTSCLRDAGRYPSPESLGLPGVETDDAPTRAP